MPERLNNEPRQTHRVGEVADALRVHRITVYRWIAAGKIPVERIGGVIRITDPVFRRLTGTDTAA